MANVVIYGGGLQAVAAAAKFLSETETDTVDMIVPYVAPEGSSYLGGLATYGGQNFFDLRRWNNDLVTKGTFSWWLSQVGQFYNVEELSKLLYNDLNKYNKDKGRIVFWFGYDICEFEKAYQPYRITEVSIRKIVMDEFDCVQWKGIPRLLHGDIFIDASDDGKLMRIVNSSATVGRSDWPTQFLDEDERSGHGRQQAATLMYKVKNAKPDLNNFTPNMRWDRLENGAIGCYGGWTQYRGEFGGAVSEFNKANSDNGFIIKPINAAQDGANSDEWWINNLLVFNVDGRAHERDKEYGLYPTDVREDYTSVDCAYRAARRVLDSDLFIKALRSFSGFENAELVRDENGKPVTGNTLYLRETIHIARNSSIRYPNTEDINYAVTTKHCATAGDNRRHGRDIENYPERIGLNYYWTDINAYKVDDLIDESGKYIWGWEVSRKLRPDISIDNASPYNPVYIPYPFICQSEINGHLM